MLIGKISYTFVKHTVMEKVNKRAAKKKADDTLLPNLVSLPSYARRMGVTRQAVHYQVHVAKNIVPVFVGMDRDPYIDWTQYKDFPFNELKVTPKL